MGILKHLLLSFLLLLIVKLDVNSQIVNSLKIRHAKLYNNEFIPVVIKVTNSSDSVIYLFYDEIIGLSGVGRAWYGWGGGIFQDDKLIEPEESREIELKIKNHYCFLTKYGLFNFNLKDHCFFGKQLSITPGSSKKIRALVTISEQACNNLQKGIDYNIKIIYNTDDLLNRYPKLIDRNFTRGLHLEGNFIFRL